MIIINRRITSAINVLRCFVEKESRIYWLKEMDLCDSEKGFIYLYLGLGKVL